VKGANTYHSATSTPSFVEPNGMGITNTINKVELAAITAAIFHGHSHTMIVLPLTASHLSTKSESPCCTLSFTATTHKGML